MWIILLDYASQSTERGKVNNLEIEEIAIMAQLDNELVTRILAAMRSRGMLQDDGTITTWNKRQRDDSRERVRRFRNKQQQPVTAHVTEPTVTCNDLVTRTEQNRTEQRRTETPLAESSAFALEPTGPTFDEFWAVWWNKTAKEEARKAFAVTAREFTPTFLVESALADRKRWESREEWNWRSRLHPATWLRGKRWKDELPPANASTPGRKLTATEEAKILWKERGYGTK